MIADLALALAAAGWAVALAALWALRRVARNPQLLAKALARAMPPRSPVPVATTSTGGKGSVRFERSAGMTTSTGFGERRASGKA